MVVFFSLNGFSTPKGHRKKPQYVPLNTGARGSEDMWLRRPGTSAATASLSLEVNGHEERGGRFGVFFCCVLFFFWDGLEGLEGLESLGWEIWC